MRLRRCVLAAGCLLGAGFFGYSSPTFFGQVLADWDHVWKYETANTNLAPYPWTGAGFDDSLWNYGQGVLAFPITERLPAGQTNRTLLNHTPGYITHYFRTTFEWNRFESVYLTFSNLFDDGVVYHLNGVELRRLRMPAGDADGSTLAVFGREAVDGYEPFIVESPPVIQGINILAAEVHQSSTTSGDVVFACYVRADQARPPCGWLPPQNVTLTLLECSSTNLTVRVEGYPSPILQWCKDGEPIPDATNTTYSLTNIGIKDQGVYACRELTDFGSCELAVFSVYVIMDLSPLYVEQAVALLNLTNIRVRFSMPVDPVSAQDIFNYAVGDLTIETAELDSSQREALLTTSSRNAGQFYEIDIAQIYSGPSACGGTVLLNPTSRRMDLETVVLPFGAVWKYEDTGNDLGATWREGAYNDELWPSGPALLGFEDSQGTLDTLATQGLFLRTPLNVFGGPQGVPTTYYLRTFVDIRFSPRYPFVLQHVTDDGAIFYVNGTEAGRFNMPLVPIVYSTLAITAPPEGEIRSLPLPGFVQGTNLLAVELHQNTTSGGDILFGAQLVGIVPGDSAPELKITRHPQSGAVTLSWRGSAVLEETDSFPPHWTASTNQSNPQTISADHTARFYRLRQ